MNIDNITPSVLHVVSKETIDIQDDLNSSPTKTIAELIDEKENQTEQTCDGK